MNHTKIYILMKRKIEREGLTDEIKDMLDVYLLGERITLDEYKELMEIDN